VALPRKVQIYHLDRETYNTWIQKSRDSGLEGTEYNYLIPARGSATAIDLGLGHTLGNPFSYPSAAEKTTIQNKGQGFFFTMGAQPVGGSTTGSLNFGLSQEISKETTWDWGAAVGVAFSAEIGFFAQITSESFAKVEYNGSSSTSISTETSIEGQVPDISPNLWDNAGYLFRTALMTYPVVDQDQQYTVVTYWVER
jgi:hypothetical protein